MVASGSGNYRWIALRLVRRGHMVSVGDISPGYINPHGTSTLLGGTNAALVFRRFEE
jgi:3-oxoacyl-(acyl-carrier-protein) synthase